MVVEITFEDINGATYPVDMVDISAGEYLITRAEEIELPCIFIKDADGVNHIETYNRIVDSFGKNLTESAVNTVVTNGSKPRYTQNINPLSEVDSYLLKMNLESTSDYHKNWWVVLSGIEDGTVLRGSREVLTLTLFPLVPENGETFSEIIDEYEV